MIAAMNRRALLAGLAAALAAPAIVRANTLAPQHMIGAGFGNIRGNLLWNWDFRMWSHGNAGTIETPPASQGAHAADEWYVGPGYGAKVEWSRQSSDAAVPWSRREVPNYLRLAWARAATQGEDQYLPGFRYTFLEQYITVPSLPQLCGRTLSVARWIRATGDTNVKPIAWVNYRNGDYQIVNIAGGWTATTAWKCMAHHFELPALDQLAHPIDQTNYVGVGLDVTYPGVFTFDLGPARAVVVDP